MKKTFLLVGLIASVMMMSSCNKDDIELLRHPFRVQGDLSPSFGLPVISSGQMNLNDLLTSFSGSFSGLITDDNTITFHYDTSIRETINIGGMVSKGHPSVLRTAPLRGEQRGVNGLRTVKGHPTKYVAPFISRDTVIEYSIPIDIFENADLQDIVDAQLSIQELLLNLSVYVSGQCPENVDSVLRAYVNARVDNLTIKYTGHDNQTHSFFGFANQSLPLNNIIEGGSMTFDGVNLAEIINSLPRSITAGFHLHVEVDSGLIVDNIYNILSDTSAINSFSVLLDSLKMTSLTYGTDLDVKLPFEVRIGHLPYSFDLPLQGNGAGEGGSDASEIFDKIDTILTDLLGEGAANTDSSKVAAVIGFANGIPLDLTLSGVLVDGNGNEIYTLFGNQTIASAVTDVVEGHPGTVQAVRDSVSNVVVELTVEALKKLAQASALRLNLVAATANFATDPNYRVVKRDDYLKVKMMVKLDPSIQIDMQLFDGFGSIIDRIPFIN